MWKRIINKGDSTEVKEAIHNIIEKDKFKKK
jgi:hypothetical protein